MREEGDVAGGASDCNREAGHNSTCRGGGGGGDLHGSEEETFRKHVRELKIRILHGEIAKEGSWGLLFTRKPEEKTVSSPEVGGVLPGKNIVNRQARARGAGGEGIPAILGSSPERGRGVPRGPSIVVALGPVTSRNASKFTWK